MPTDDIFARQAIVLTIALIYWIGVTIQARRVRRKIGRQPNVRPRGTREKLLWAGWILVVLTWMALPFIVSRESGNILVDLHPTLLQTPGLLLGILLVLAGYAGTHWCYVSMGDTWRMGINRKEETRLVTSGPYGLIRHPIYSFQGVILIGVAVLLPAVLALLIIPFHLICVWVKAADEEAHLVTSHGQAYLDYCARTGRLLPKLI
jgi:protein-S-isoprenylcysteine O-methyltransferase Ste14